MVTDAILQHATKLRRELHRIPELCFEERETAELIRGELRRLKIDYATGPASAPTATIALLGDAAKPCVMLRADIDALPIAEANQTDWRSMRPGRMHACGHDGHTANLLGVAASLVDEARELPVCVKLVFQPAEEGGGGGDKLVQAGLLRQTGEFGPKVVAAFGLHGWPLLPLGTVTTKPGPILAATDNFRLSFRGRGGHAAMPHTTDDPLAAAAGAVVNLQQFVSRELDPTEPAVLSVTQFHAGTTHNVIAEEAWFEGTARTLSPEARLQVREAIERRGRGIAEAARCELEFRWEPGYPPTINDPAMTDYVLRIARETLGADRVLPLARPTMGGEDFAYYLEQVPGCFFFLGLCPADCDRYPPLHTDRFDFVDEAMKTGIGVMCSLVRRYR